MENIRRSISLFFATYGGLLFQIIGTIALILLALRGLDYLYKENNIDKLNENVVSEQEIALKEKATKKEKENILFISEFLDYCNNKKIQEAYNMLSEKCITEKFQTIERFKKEYVEKIFTYKKDYKIEKIENLYKITILEGVLQSGKTENRDGIISYYEISENVLEKEIYIER